MWFDASYLCRGNGFSNYSVRLSLFYLVVRFFHRRFRYLFMERGKRGRNEFDRADLIIEGDLCACSFLFFSVFFFTNIFASCKYLYCPGMNIYTVTEADCIL